MTWTPSQWLPGVYPVLSQRELNLQHLSPQFSNEHPVSRPPQHIPAACCLWPLRIPPMSTGKSWPPARPSAPWNRSFTLHQAGRALSCYLTPAKCSKLCKEWMDEWMGQWPHIWSLSHSGGRGWGWRIVLAQGLVAGEPRQKSDGSIFRKAKQCVGDVVQSVTQCSVWPQNP